MSIVSINPSFNRSDAFAEGVGRSREQQLQEAAEQFEALFLQQILKQMRKASDVLAEGNPMRSRELDTLRDFYDEALAEHLSGRKQTGIADLLVAQLSGAGSQDLGTVDAEQMARSAPLPARQEPGVINTLRSTWQSSVESVGRVIDSASASFSALVDRVVQQESGGRVDAVSPKGAQGLMQLMPGTARDMAAELGIEFDQQRLLKDGDYNRRLGSAYLNKMLDRYEGHQALALAAYNAGPGRVDEWLERYGDPRGRQISTGDWIEQIPFAETRNYARSILSDLAQTPATAASAVSGVALPSADAWQSLSTVLKDGSGLQSAAQAAASFNLSDQIVASTDSVAESAAANTAPVGLAAFAQPIWPERKEKEL